MAVGSRKSIIDDYYDVVDSQLRKSILECFRD